MTDQNTNQRNQGVSVISVVLLTVYAIYKTSRYLAGNNTTTATIFLALAWFFALLGRGYIVWHRLSKS